MSAYITGAKVQQNLILLCGISNTVCLNNSLFNDQEYPNLTH